MLVKGKSNRGEFGIFTTEDIEAGNLIFSHDEWIEDEQYGWHVLTIDEVNDLPEDQKRRFLRYSYDLDFDKIIGTLDWRLAKNISNFMNHSCEPNMMYDLNDNIEAKRLIYAGEELTIDYGTFIVNMDQDFLCACGASNCRRNIKGTDWINLIPHYQFHFPRFLHDSIRDKMQVISA